MEVSIVGGGCTLSLRCWIASNEIDVVDVNVDVLILVKTSLLTVVSQFWVAAVSEKGEGRSSQVRFLRFFSFNSIQPQVVSKTPGPRHLSMITSIGREVFQVLSVSLAS